MFPKAGVNRDIHLGMAAAGMQHNDTRLAVAFFTIYGR
jgi:hypothetical protein